MLHARTVEMVKQNEYLLSDSFVHRRHFFMSEDESRLLPVNKYNIQSIVYFSGF